jgi:hypothetical protein
MIANSIVTDFSSITTPSSALVLRPQPQVQLAPSHSPSLSVSQSDIPPTPLDSNSFTSPRLNKPIPRPPSSSTTSPSKQYTQVFPAPPTSDLNRSRSSSLPIEYNNPDVITINSRAPRDAVPVYSVPDYLPYLEGTIGKDDRPLVFGKRRGSAPIFYSSDRLDGNTYDRYGSDPMELSLSREQGKGTTNSSNLKAMFRRSSAAPSPVSPSFATMQPAYSINSGNGSSRSRGSIQEGSTSSISKGVLKGMLKFTDKLAGVNVEENYKNSMIEEQRNGYAGTDGDDRRSISEQQLVLFVHFPLSSRNSTRLTQFTW